MEYIYKKAKSFQRFALEARYPFNQAEYVTEVLTYLWRNNVIIFSWLKL